MEAAQTEARAQREFLETVLDTAEALVVVTDRSGGIVRFNRACERATGRSFEEVRGHRPWTLIPRDQRRAVKRIFTEITAGRFPIRFENDWLRRDGTRIRVAWSNTALTDAAGEVTHAIGIGIDITELRKAQLALQTTEAFSRTVLNSLTAHIAVLDRNGGIVATSAAWDQFARENGGVPDRTGVACDYLAVCRGAQLEDAGARESLRLVGEALQGRPGGPAVENACHAQTTRCWFLLSATPLQAERGGCVVSLVDISALKEAELALQESDARITAVLESATEGILAIDRGGLIQVVNSALERMFGYGRDDLVGRPLDKLLPARFRAVHRQHQEAYFERPARRPMGSQVALFGRSKDAREFPIEIGLGDFEVAGCSYAVAFVRVLEPPRREGRLSCPKRQSCSPMIIRRCC